MLIFREEKKDLSEIKRHEKIALVSLNKDYPAIVIPEDKAEEFKIIAEFITVL